MVSNSEEKVHDFKHKKKVSNSERKRKGNFRGSKRLLCYADNPSFFFVCVAVSKTQLKKRHLQLPSSRKQEIQLKE